MLSGGFDDDGDGNIEDDDNNQVPITPAQNSSMQAGSNSSGTITTVITVPQDADDLGAGAYSPNPASVSGDSTITWNNIDDSPHTATADDGSFDTGIINGGSSGSALISTSTGTRTIPYHCNVHPEMRGTLQVIALSTIPSSNSTFQDAAVTVTSSSNNSTIQNLQEAILALQQVIGSLQQALVALQQSASQDGNVTIFSGNNNTAASPIQEEQQQPALPPPQQPQSQQQQQQRQQENLTVSIVQGSSTLTDNGGFQPNRIQLPAGDTVTWRNDDLEAHTVTSGSDGVPDNKFNSSPNFIPLITPGATFSHTFIQAGEYPYFCLLHPNMVGTVTVVI